MPREKTKDEIEREEEEYREYLQREVGEDLSELITVEAEDVAGAEVKHEEERPKKKSKTAKAKDAKSKQEEDQEFLMKYVPSPLFRAPTSFLFFT